MNNDILAPNTRELLLWRAAEHSQRGNRSDSHHLALVIEGGGMRGVVAGGMVSALEERGLLPCFDSIHGSSAGACAGAYFAAGQARLGTRIYYEDINNRRFIDLRRPLVGRPVMSTHFLIDHVMRINKPLNVTKILSNPGLLHIAATDATTGSPRGYYEYRDVEHFFRILKGTITIPIIAGKPVEVDGALLIDGGMVQQIALQSALDLGATHVVVLMTRMEGELERPDRAGGLRLDNLLLRLRHGANMERVYRERNAKINAIIRRITVRARDELIQMDGIVRPSGSSEVDRLTTDGTLLRAADLEARNSVFRYLDQDAARRFPAVG